MLEHRLRAWGVHPEDNVFHPGDGQLMPDAGRSNVSCLVGNAARNCATLPVVVSCVCVLVPSILLPVLCHGEIGGEVSLWRIIGRCSGCICSSRLNFAD